MAVASRQSGTRDGRAISRFPRRSGPVLGATLVDAQLLAVVGFTDHALERFIHRTGIAPADRAAIERIVRDLLLQEGLRVPRPPQWAHVTPAPFYLQAGNYLLFVGRPGRKGSVRSHTISTVIAHDDWTWAEALAHGALGTPPPPARPSSAHPPRLLDSLGRVRSVGGLLGLLGAHRAREADARVQAQADFERQARDYVTQRRAARERHLSLHGFTDDVD